MAYATGEMVDVGVLPAVGVETEERLDRTATFFRTDARRPRILDTTGSMCEFGVSLMDGLRED